MKERSAVEMLTHAGFVEAEFHGWTGANIAVVQLFAVIHDSFCWVIMLSGDSFDLAFLSRPRQLRIRFAGIDVASLADS